MRKLLSVVALIAATALSMAACSGAQDAGEEPTSLGTLKVGVNPVPHAEIVQFVKDNLAEAAGLDLEIEVFQDYVLPNKALADGSLDANYYMHGPFFDSQVEEFGYDFVPYPGIHIEPLGVYSTKYETLAEVPEGAQIGVSNDPANQARGLRLLEAEGLFGLADTGDVDPTVNDLADNPKNVELIELDPQLLGVNLQDFDLAVINGNYAIETGLKPSTDAVILESGEDNPYANFLATRTELKDDPRVVKLNELLHTPEVRQFIEDTYTDGAVIPAF
ncbi:MAG: MetQ/NlpA family ABC transporter substrate-binding protein [Bifidobacteriaceae bacterium]|jgi:D-methionine transport system substrate-binding protein|nr:MetQ/NlpA family ABC transporter substrate-binding protein [Bifidobacteriaceae bacterium]